MSGERHQAHHVHSDVPSHSDTVHTHIQSGTKNVPTCFYQNFVKSPPNLIIFGTQMAKMIELCEVHSLSTSTDIC